MKMLFPPVLALLLAVAFPAFAQAPQGRERLLQSELKQQQIQRTTQRVGNQLSAIISEFERNGIAGEDVKVLRAIQMVLSRLSEKDMVQVITLLQQAQKAGDDGVAKKEVMDAYSGQKAITT